MRSSCVSRPLTFNIPRITVVPFKSENGTPNYFNHPVLLSFGLLVLLGLEEHEEESELVTTIKRAILYMKVGKRERI